MAHSNTLCYSRRGSFSSAFCVRQFLTVTQAILELGFETMLQVSVVREVGTNSASLPTRKSTTFNVY